LTKTAVASLGIPYAADGNRGILGLPLPDVFAVYKQISGAPSQHADNAETERFFRMQVAIFSRSGTLPATDAAMIAAGFMFSRETELPYDDQTGHFGVAREYTILLNQP
jgi:hypothetical protein